MTIFKCELGKLFRSPALIAFLLICVGFNVLIMSDKYYDYSDFVAEASKIVGYELGAQMEEKLPQLETLSEYPNYGEFFAQDVIDKTDVFDDYNAASIGEIYIEKLELTGYPERAMREKYLQLQEVADEKSVTNESLTLYLASSTSYARFELYAIVMKFIIVECGLIAALIMFLSLGYEHNAKTSHIVYASKTGRNVIRNKLFAALTAGALAFVILTALTLILYFIFHDYGNVWGSSMSSVYNELFDSLVGEARPFITWKSYTVFSYLCACIGISALITISFSLTAFIIGSRLKNGYIGFIIFLIVNAGIIVFTILVPSQILKHIAVLAPIWIWHKSGVWFTDGGADILWKNFETLGISASLLVLIALSVFSIVRFKKREEL